MPTPKLPVKFRHRHVPVTFEEFEEFLDQEIPPIDDALLSRLTMSGTHGILHFIIKRHPELTNAELDKYFIQIGAPGVNDQKTTPLRYHKSHFKKNGDMLLYNAAVFLGLVDDKSLNHRGLVSYKETPDPEVAQAYFDSLRERKDAIDALLKKGVKNILCIAREVGSIQKSVENYVMHYRPEYYRADMQTLSAQQRFLGEEIRLGARDINELIITTGLPSEMIVSALKQLTGETWPVISNRASGVQTVCHP